jgi:hypothetical protein
MDTKEEDYPRRARRRRRGETFNSEMFVFVPFVDKSSF